MTNKVAIFWFRRDLRLEDNRALSKALSSNSKVLPVFIFDSQILAKLPKNDARVSFIHKTLLALDKKLKENHSSLHVEQGNPLEVFKKLQQKFNIENVFVNKDYEPSAIQRDKAVKEFLQTKDIGFIECKDQVIFEEDEILKQDGLPYTVFTPYKKKWLTLFSKNDDTKTYSIDFTGFFRFTSSLLSLQQIGFEKSAIEVKPYMLSNISNYEQLRDFPALDKTSYLSVYLRFGVVSIRQIVSYALQKNDTFLSELIWREFFMQILFHFPKVVSDNFKSKYDCIPWRNNEEEFEKWCQGNTGYPIVDAGMRQLNQTGYMHNRVRMITAGFLCKHLLIDWRWGEAYFAQKLLDYELSSNNGNWQWAAGTGCDAAPYFRVFNPAAQVKKFDATEKYLKKWLPELQKPNYPKPIVEHKFARERAISTYKNAFTNQIH